MIPKNLRHIKLFEAYNGRYSPIDRNALLRLGVSHEDILHCEKIADDVMKDEGDSGTCVVGAALLANGREVVEPYSQGNTGPERIYKAVRDYLAPKYPKVKFEIQWGNMD